MGYRAYFNGEIKIGHKDLSVLAKVREEVLKLAERVGEHQVYINDCSDHYSIVFQIEEFSNYGDVVEYCCFNIANIDKTAKGEIYCNGDGTEEIIDT